MMDAFRALLEARNPERDCQRWYRVEAGTDLFGVWLVDVSYGRIGTRGGRHIRYAVADETEAKDLVSKTLRRRATAQTRLGVGYRVRELADPHQWFPVNADGVDSAGK